MGKIDMMGVPPTFKHLIRKKAGEKNLSMYKYLEECAREAESENKAKRIRIGWLK